jgi:hypothetical protein
MSEIIEHYSRMCFRYAGLAAAHKKNAKSKKWNKQYQQQDWEYYLMNEAQVILYAERLMKRLEEEMNLPLLVKLFKEGSVK